jgi:peroxiredoxin
MLRSGAFILRETAMIQLGQVAPDFEAETTHGPIRFHDWLGSSWGVLFSTRRTSRPSARRSSARRRG